MFDTTYYAAILLNALLGKADHPSYSDVYLALFTADPTTSGSLVSEVSGGDYDRVALEDKFPTATGLTVSNDTLIEFPLSTGVWGTVTHVGLCDSGTPGAGNLLRYAPLQPGSQYIGSGFTPKFSIGNLILRKES